MARTTQHFSHLWARANLPLTGSCLFTFAMSSFILLKVSILTLSSQLIPPASASWCSYIQFTAIWQKDSDYLPAYWEEFSSSQFTFNIRNFLYEIPTFLFHISTVGDSTQGLLPFNGSSCFAVRPNFGSLLIIPSTIAVVSFTKMSSMYELVSFFTISSLPRIVFNDCRHDFRLTDQAKSLSG